MVSRMAWRSAFVCTLLAESHAFWFERGNRHISGRVVDVLDYGAVPDLSDTDTARNNTLAINAALTALEDGDTLVIPTGKEFYALGGIQGTGLKDATIQFFGTLRALPDFDAWPLQPSSTKNYADFVSFVNCSYLTIEGLVSQSGSEIDGMGKKWWNAFILGTLPHSGRPKLVSVLDSSNILVQDLLLHASPSFHLKMYGIAEVEVRNVTVLTDRQDVRKAKRLLRELADSVVDNRVAGEPGLEPQDLNTDGIDPSGRDVWVHHCHILNDDDSIAVKPCDSGSGCPFSDCSENMLFEDLVLTGFGASIGSVPPHPDVNCVRNITFRRIDMPRTGKGIYVKSNPSCDGGNTTAVIQDVVYEDVSITDPSWWPIWIGPQQQHEPNQQLGEKCALDYPIDEHCPTQGCVDFTNITLRNVYIEKPLLSPGVVLGNSTNPMKNITFINVTVVDPGYFPFKREYLCENAEVTSIDCEGSPVPNCTVVT